MRGTFPNTDNPTHPFLVFGYDARDGSTLYGILHLGTGEEERLGLTIDAATAAATSRALAARNQPVAA